MLSCYPSSSSIYASDIIPALINVFKLVQSNPTIVFEEYQLRWLEQKSDKNFYYQVRDRFNKNGLLDPHDFLFLMRLCYNGLPRFNARGEFNTSLHINRDGINPLTFKDIISKWHSMISNVTFSVEDYRSAVAHATAGDFVFLDPPYFSTKGQYHPSASSFDFLDLKTVLENMNQSGVLWLLTLDADFEMQTNDLLRGVYSDKKSSTFRSSSFKRLAHQTGGRGGNTIYANYLFNNKETLF